MRRHARPPYLEYGTSRDLEIQPVPDRSKHNITLDHFDCGISRDQSCEWGTKWDLCAPGLSCRFASERTLHFRWPPSPNVGLDGVIYSDCVSNLLVYLGAESAVSSENPLKSLGIRPDFDPPYGCSNPPTKPPQMATISECRYRLRVPDLNIPGIASRSWNVTDAAIKSRTRTSA